jgi:phosphoheptose isomerase
MDLDAFYAEEFDQHAALLIATRAQCRAAFAALVRAAAACVRGGGKLMFFGNGGSAADAQHLATELAVRYVKDRAPIAAIALTTDSSALTAIGNDLGFAQSFARQLRALGRPGDLAIGISTAEGGARAQDRRGRVHRRLGRRHEGPMRPAGLRALDRDRAHPGDAHHAGADAVRRARARTGPRVRRP